MQITIKSIETKEGTAATGKNAGNPYKLFVVWGEDGLDYTTFDAGVVGLPAGSVIRPDSITTTEKDGHDKRSFKKFTLIPGEKATAPDTAQAPTGKADTRPGMTPADWAEKDRLERFSIESQVAFKGVVELFTHDKIGGILAEAALDWALDRLTSKPAQPPAKKPAPAATSAKSTALDTDLYSLVFKDIGELKTACTKQLKMTVAQIGTETAGHDLSTVEGRADAWLQILVTYGEKPDEKDTAEKGKTPPSEAENDALWGEIGRNAAEKAAEGGAGQSA